MTKKEYNKISNITYKIQDLADELLTIKRGPDAFYDKEYSLFEMEHKMLYEIAQGLQDHRDEEA